MTKAKTVRAHLPDSERKLSRLVAILAEMFYGGAAAKDFGFSVSHVVDVLRNGEWLDGYYAEGIAAPGEETRRDVAALRRAARHYLAVLDEPVERLSARPAKRKGGR